MRKSGIVAIIGKPNVGKSTLLNNILGQKIAITSRKPQTTRHNLLGIYTKDDKQIVFIDTPGINKETKKALNRQMNKFAWQSMEFVDAVIMLFETGNFSEEEQEIVNNLKNLKIPKFCILNKIDKKPNKEDLLAELEVLAKLCEWQEIIPISALKKQNLEDLINSLTKVLKEQDFIYPEEQITTAGMRYLAAELIREKLFRYLHQEVPYALGVIIEKYQEEEDKISIMANIITERESQKGIIIGKNARTLKAVGTAARKELEDILEKKVFLKTIVSVKNNWRDNDSILQSMNSGNENF